MSDPRFTRSDISSIHAANRQAGPADAVRGLLSTEGGPLAGDDPLDPLARDADRTLFEAGVLRAPGHSSGQGGTAAVRPVTSRRGQRMGAGR